MRSSPVRIRANVVATPHPTIEPFRRSRGIVSGPFGTASLRGRETSVMSADIEDARSDSGMPQRKFIVQCPECNGSGRVVPFGSRARVGCRLCWERGRVSRIVADSWWREHGEKGA
jgi:hypothetical protein